MNEAWRHEAEMMDNVVGAMMSLTRSVPERIEAAMIDFHAAFGQRRAPDGAQKHAAKINEIMGRGGQ